MAGITAGRPHLVMPQLCDQFAVVDRGAAAVRTAARHLLADAVYTRRAAALRDEVTAMPAPATVAAELERLASLRRDTAGAIR